MPQQGWGLAEIEARGTWLREWQRGWAQKGGQETPENPIKIPWFWLNQSRGFQAFQLFFVHLSWKLCHEISKMHENAWKNLDLIKIQGIYSFFQVEKGILNPPFCAPTLCHPSNGSMHAKSKHPKHTGPVKGICSSRGLCSGKENTCHRHKRIWGIVPGLAGWQKFVYVFSSGQWHSL